MHVQKPNIWTLSYTIVYEVPTKTAWNIHLINYGQNAYFRTFWTFSHREKSKNLTQFGTKSSCGDKSIGQTPTYVGYPLNITPIPRHAPSLWKTKNAIEAL
jgi:hypothetical protein